MEAFDVTTRQTEFIGYTGAPLPDLRDAVIDEYASKVLEGGPATLARECALASESSQQTLWAYAERAASRALRTRDEDLLLLGLVALLVGGCGENAYEALVPLAALDDASKQLDKPLEEVVRAAEASLGVNAVGKLERSWFSRSSEDRDLSAMRYELKHEEGGPRYVGLLTAEQPEFGTKPFPAIVPAKNVSAQLPISYALEKLSNIQVPRYRRSTLPGELDSDLDTLFDGLLQADAKAFEHFVSLVGEEHLAALNVYAQRAANRALLAANPTLILHALLAIAAAGINEGSPGGLMALALCDDACRRLDVDIRDGLEQVEKLLPPQTVSSIVVRWFMRKPRERTPEAMGFSLLETPNGLMYELF